jgi:hypothetical protein
MKAGEELRIFTGLATVGFATTTDTNASLDAGRRLDGCLLYARKREPEHLSINPSQPECYALAYSDAIRNASARLFPIWAALIPGPQAGALIDRPNPAFGDESWRGMTEFARWKRIAADSLELMFSGRFEAISIHVARSGSNLSGRAPWLSDVIEPGPKPSMRVEGIRESCPPNLQRAA